MHELDLHEFLYLFNAKFSYTVLEEVSADITCRYILVQS